MKAVAIYARISSDVLGEGLGVARQRQDCTALAERHGWTVVDTYVDNDVSAFTGKRRPAYERLLEDVRSGRVNGIVAWHTDRLHRSPKELESFIDLIDFTKCTVDTVQAGELDLTTPSGRVMARTLGAFARYESEHKSERVRRKLEQNAAEGKHHGGERPFGWNDDRVTIREGEAELVRFCIRQVTAGASLVGIARSLTERGSKNADGQPWTRTLVRKMVLRPYNAGLRTYKGEVIGAGQWEPIVARDEWEAARRVLIDPQRRTNPGSNARVHLLSRIARCGVCGKVKRGASGKGVGGISRKIYRCDGRGCTTRDKAALEELVTAVILARLRRPDAADLLAPSPAAQPECEVEATQLRQRLSDAAEDYAEGLLTRDQLRSITVRLRPRVEQLEASSPPASTDQASLAEMVSAEDVHAAWERLDLRQRKVLVDLLVSVTVLPAPRGRAPFDPAAVRIEWKAQA